MSVEKRSIEDYTWRMRARLELVDVVIDDEINNPHGDSNAILQGVRQVVEDILGDLAELDALPFPLTEYRGEPIEEWLVKRSTKKRV